MKSRELTKYEKAALEYSMVKIATGYAKDWLGLPMDEIPDFSRYIVWYGYYWDEPKDCIRVADDVYDVIEIDDHLGMRNAFIDEESNQSYLGCVVLDEEGEPLTIDGAEVAVYVEIDVDDIVPRVERIINASPFLSDYDAFDERDFHDFYDELLECRRCDETPDAEALEVS